MPISGPRFIIMYLALIMCTASASAQAAPFDTWPHGTYITVPGPIFPAGNGLNSSSIYFSPVWIGQNASPSDISFTTQAGTAAGTCEVGIYNSSASTGYPTSLVAAPPAVAISTTPKTYDVALSPAPALVEQLYWIAITCNNPSSASPIFMGSASSFDDKFGNLWQVTFPLFGAGTLGASQGFSIFGSFSYGPLPSTAPTTLSPSGGTLVLGLKR